MLPPSLWLFQCCPAFVADFPDAAWRVALEQAVADHARKATEGDVDECRDAIVNLLEGGEQAFKRRQERYAY